MVYGYDYLIGNPVGLAIGVFIILFAVTYSVLEQWFNNRGASLPTAFIVGALAAWNLYNRRFYGWEATIVFLLYVALMVLFLRMIWAFFKHLSGTAGRFKSSFSK